MKHRQISRTLSRLILSIVLLSIIVGAPYTNAQSNHIYPPQSNDITLETKGKVNTRFYYNLKKQDNNYNTRESMDLRAKLENTITLENTGFSLTLNGELRYELFEIGEKGNIDLMLREAYVKTEGDANYISFGNQTITWGKLDDLVILDRLSPQDYRWAVLYDKQDRKEPVPMFKFNYYGNEYQMEYALLPLIERSGLDFFGTDWALFDKMKKAFNSGAYPPETKEIINNISIQESTPSDQTQMGIRLRHTVNNIDYSLYYMTFYNHIPAIKERTAKGQLAKRFLFEPSAENLQALASANPDINDLTLETAYNRIHAIGIDFETIAGMFGLRGELGYFTDMPYIQENTFNIITKDTVSAGIGIDRTTDNNIYWNIQLAGDFIIDHEDLFATKKFSPQAAFNINKDFLMGDLVADFSSIIRFADGDWMLNPELSYKLNNGIEISCGSFIFGGDKTTLLGRYDANDVIYSEITYFF